METRAVEHDRLATELVSRLVDPLKHIATRYEELRKRHADYAAKLERERDAAYADLKKTKHTYDSICQEVESRRKKTESAADSGKQKAQVVYQQQMLDMHNAKVRIK